MATVNLTPGSTSVNLYNNAITLTPSTSITMQPLKVNASVTINVYVGYAAYYSGRYYEFELTCSCNDWTYNRSITVTTYPTTNRGWVTGTFSWSDTAGGFSVNSFTIKQTYRYNTNYNANIRPASEGQHTAVDNQGSTSYTNVHAPNNVYWYETGSTGGMSVPPSATRTLMWSEAYGGINTTVSNYYIYRSTSQNGSYSYLASTTGTQYSVTGPSEGSYYYKIKSISSPSGYDSELSTSYAYLMVYVGTLSAPTGLSLTSQYLTPGSTTTLSWNAVSNAANNNVTGYTVYKTANGTKTALGTVNTTNYTVTAEASGSATYTVKANGQYSDSAESSGIVLYTYTLPTAPTTVALSATSAAPGVTLTLSWSGAADGTYNAISGYEIYRSSSATTGFTKYGETLAATASSASVVSNSSQGGTYYYKVRVLGTRAGYSESDTVSVTTYTYSAVGAPQTISVTPNNVPAGGSATLSWGEGTPSTYVTVSSYQVWVCTTQNGTYERLGNNTTDRTMTVYGPASGSYYYKVQSIGSIAGYDSALSTVIAVLSVNSAPSIPENFEVSPYEYNDGNLTFGWDASTDPEGDSVYYEISMVDSNNLTTVIVNNLTTTSYTADLTTEIPRGSTVTFYVRAYDSNSNYSGSSNTASVTRVQSISPTDVTVVGNVGSGTYSYYPKFILRTSRRLKVVSSSSINVIPSSLVDSGECIYVKVLDSYNTIDTYFTNNPSATTYSFSKSITLEDAYGNQTTYTLSASIKRRNLPVVTANVTKVYASHITTLRDILQGECMYLVNEMISFTTGAVQAGITSLSLWLTHVEELQNKVSYITTEMTTLVPDFSPSITFTLPVNNCPTASVQNYLCSLIDEYL